MAIERTQAAMDEVASQIHRDIDEYIVPTANPGHVDLHRRLVVLDLNQILGEAVDGSPSTFVLNSTKGNTLILTYTLRKGVRHGSWRNFGNTPFLQRYQQRGEVSERGRHRHGRLCKCFRAGIAFSRARRDLVVPMGADDRSKRTEHLNASLCLPR